MRVAALYDVHGNLPALEAVLADVEREGVDLIVSGGDVSPGPMPAGCVDLLLSLDERVVFVRGNAERQLVEAKEGRLAPSEEFGPAQQWIVDATPDAHVERFRAWPLTATLEVDGLGRVLFCHAVPYDDMPFFLETTPEERAARILGPVDADTVVCGHTHMQFDRGIAGVRVVNAGSVGMPYEDEPAAYWALLGPEVELRRTRYDAENAAARILATGWPSATEFVDENVRVIPSRAEALAAFEPRVPDR
jgi:predicted phosphodiesterase